MSHKLTMVLITVGMISLLLLPGCGPSSTLSLKFTPDESVTYRATTELIKDYRFEQPTLGKLSEQQTKNTVVMEYAQTVQSIDEDGSAVLQITIKGLKINLVNKNKVQLAFDSEKDTKSPLTKLIGQSYTIKMTPTGKAEAVDTQKAIAAVTSSYDKSVTKGILDTKSIATRHSVPALPADPTKTYSVKSSWNEIVPSPPGALAPKSFEKVYTVTDIKDNIATVSMVAGESAEPAADFSQAAGGMGPFARMFDNNDEYTGSLQVDLTDGQVLNFEETLISSYLAQQMPENGDPQKGPDALTMRFTNRIQLEKLD